MLYRLQVEVHLEHMNKLADGIPRPEDEVVDVDLDLYLREVEAYDALMKPPEKGTSALEWLERLRLQVSAQRRYVAKLTILSALFQFRVRNFCVLEPRGSTESCAAVLSSLRGS